MTTKRQVLNILLWVVINGLFAVCLILGIAYNVHWALNLAKFLTWCGFFIFSIACLAKHGDPIIEIPEKSIPLSIDIVYDIVMASIFAAGGHFFYATLVIFQILLYIDIFSKNEAL